ncbi:MAG: Na/Pi cotransporter family protein [Erysipelotrichaceae bacterium]
MLHIATDTLSWTSIQWDLIIGGFALFLFGIEYMGNGLKSIAGDKLRDYIDKYTTKPWMAIIIGALVTVFIQSSSATTAITIGLVRAGLMRLDQAVGIIMGANIGTTVTAFLIGLKVEKFALYFVFIGVLFVIFSKRKKMTYLGEIILGFGILFFGLKLMGDELKLIGKLPEFNDFAMLMAQQPLLGMLGGTLMTGLVQSSSAVIGIIQKLYESGAITLAAAIPFVFGSNIGTTITAIFAAIGGSLAAKRAAGVHVMFNVGGTIIFFFLIGPMVSLLTWMSAQYGIEPMLQIAIAHIIFNVSITILFYPFIKQLVNIVKRILPGEEAERIEVKLDHMDATIAQQLPSGALEVSKQATCKMGELSISSLQEGKQMFNTQASKYLHSAKQFEDIINSLDGKITSYLMKIAQENLGDHDTEQLIENLQIIKNIERIGDLNINLVNLFDMVYDEKGNFSKEAMQDINEMYDLVIEMVTLAMEFYDTRTPSLPAVIQDKENYLDLLEEKARKRHFHRMTTNDCAMGIAGSVYVDILANLERIGDHCCNIVKLGEHNI